MVVPGAGGWEEGEGIGGPSWESEAVVFCFLRNGSVI